MALQTRIWAAVGRACVLLNLHSVDSDVAFQFRQRFQCEVSTENHSDRADDVAQENKGSHGVSLALALEIWDRVFTVGGNISR